jgi:hypothetical protein
MPGMTGCGGGDGAETHSIRTTIPPIAPDSADRAVATIPTHYPAAEQRKRLEALERDLATLDRLIEDLPVGEDGRVDRARQLNHSIKTELVMLRRALGLPPLPLHALAEVDREPDVGLLPDGLAAAEQFLIDGESTGMAPDIPTDQAGGSGRWGAAGIAVWLSLAVGWLGRIGRRRWRDGSKAVNCKLGHGPYAEDCDKQGI